MIIPLGGNHVASTSGEHEINDTYVQANYETLSTIMNRLREAGQIRNVTRNLENEYDSDSVDEYIEAEPPPRMDENIHQDRRTIVAPTQPRIAGIQIGEGTNIVAQREEACQEQHQGWMIRANMAPKNTPGPRKMLEGPIRNQ